MFHIWKIILYVILELVFDSKDEYDFNSAKFNYRKFTVAIMLGLSLAANVWANYRDWETDRKSTRLNSSHSAKSRMPSSA